MPQQPVDPEDVKAARRDARVSSEAMKRILRDLGELQEEYRANRETFQGAREFLEGAGHKDTALDATLPPSCVPADGMAHLVYYRCLAPGHESHEHPVWAVVRDGKVRIQALDSWVRCDLPETLSLQDAQRHLALILPRPAP